MAEDPLPVVICSALSAARSEQAVLALTHGAVEIIMKPKLGVSDFLSDSATTIIDAVRSAAKAHTRKNAIAAQPRAPLPPRLTSKAGRVVAVGASTGGVEALTQLLGELPANAPGLLIVQHMPEGFTASFARRLDQLCAIEVREATEGDAVKSGLALICPGNRHLTLQGAPGRYRVAVEDGPLVSRHRPSVDVLFHSVARTAGKDAVGVIMTGMGADGVDGMLAMRAAGASTIAQDRASCAIFGMPREAIARGAAGQVVALDDLSRAILQAAG